jgi:membrane-bound lytic murein transglycosylase MltF
VRNDSAELKSALAAFMKTHGPGTTFGNVIIQRYTRDNRWVRNPGTTEDLRRFREALPYFRKYAKQYEFDYLLIAAQAYQESRINQKLHSPAGAVGVMQIKPATASDPNVRIANVHAMDANGLDPNEWFNSVEIVAGRKIGSETVDYVRNILKYWVAYRLALDQDEDVQQPATSGKQT